MTLIERTRDGYTFHLRLRERMMLQELLRHYPLLPPGHFRLSHNSQARLKPDDEELLRESMRGLRQRHCRWIKDLLDGPRFKAHKGQGVRLTLSTDEVEALLQILNDLRVGAWIRLGCPDLETRRSAGIHAVLSRDWFLMDLAGFLENNLLEAIHSER